MGKNKTNEEFKDEVNSLVGNEYNFLDSYSGVYNKISVKHNKCGEIYKVSPNAFLNGRRCPKCANKSRSNINNRKHEDFVKLFNELEPTDYTLLNTYTNSKTKVKVKHNICDYEYEVAPPKFLDGKRCPKCNGGIRKTHEEFIKEVYTLVENEYSILGNYKNNKTKIDIRHNTCGHKYKVSPNNFIHHNRRCPNCASSKGENRIKEWLESNDILFEQQYRFEDCRDKYPLPFDFAIKNLDDSIILLLEFDGIQHFESVEIWGGSKGLVETRRRDNIKNNYCLKNDIKLKRISYQDIDRIEEILADIFLSTDRYSIEAV